MTQNASLRAKIHANDNKQENLYAKVAWKILQKID